MRDDEPRYSHFRSSMYTAVTSHGLFASSGSMVPCTSCPFRHGPRLHARCVAMPAVAAIHCAAFAVSVDDVLHDATRDEHSDEILAPHRPLASSAIMSLTASSAV